MTPLSDHEYAALLAFRTELRRLQQWSEQRAQEAGLTHAQHQLLLAVRGHLDPRGPTIGEVAAYLLLSPSATVELVDRVEQGRFVHRVRDDDDRRVVRLRLTSTGEQRLAELTAVIVPEVRGLAPTLARLVRELSPEPDRDEPA